MLIFDIETEALPDDQLFALAGEYVAPEAPGEFDPSAVKYGNTKDESKRADILAAAKAKHDSLIADHATTLAEHRAEWEAKIRDKAALSAATARVLAIGYLSSPNGDEGKASIDGVCYSGDKAKDDQQEYNLLANFWGKVYAKMRSAARSMIGVNIFNFDLPFICRRCWILGVDVPATAFDGRYWDRIFVDLSRRWLVGQSFGSEPASFDAMGKAFGTGGKPAGVDGSMFASLWKTDKPKAIEYLANDLRQPAMWAKRMGIVQ